MTLNKIIEKLKAEKKIRRIKFRKRKGGGIVVTSINGKKFKGTEGNLYIREMSGEKLSEKQQKHLKKIRPISYSQLNKIIIKRLTRQIKEGLKKNPKLKFKVTARDVMKQIKAKGEEKTIESLKKTLDYVEGWANKGLVDDLKSKFERIATFAKDLSDAVRDHLTNIIAFLRIELVSDERHLSYDNYEIIRGLIYDEQLTLEQLIEAVYNITSKL